MVLSSTPRIVWLTTLLYTAFVIYGSLVPLEASYIEFDLAWQKFQSIPYLQLGLQSRSDWVANGVLFFPLAYLWLTALTLNRRPGTISSVFLIALISITGAFLSALIEFTQLYFPQRTVSQNDVIAETIGAILGSLAWYATHIHFVSWIDRWSQESSASDRWRDILVLYISGLVFYAVMPLDLYLSPVELYHKWQEGRINLIPLATTSKGAFLIIYEIVTDIAIWIPVPMLWSKYREFSPRKIWGLVLALAVGIEFFQLFVYSRTSDITDIFTAGIGAAIGLRLLRHFTHQHTFEANRVGFSSVGWAPAMWLTLIWLCVLLVAFWYPFNFQIQREYVSSTLDGFLSVPFSTYYWGSEYRALTELLRKILLMIPLGILIGLTAEKLVGSALNNFWVKLLWLAGIFVVFILELGQVLLPDRTGDITDAILGCIGLLIGQRAWRLYSKPPKSREKAAIKRTNPEVFLREAPLNSAEPVVKPKASTIPVIKWNSRSILFLLATLLAVSAILSFLLESSSIPYNVRELVAGHYRWLRVVGSVFTAYWVFGIPMTILFEQLNRNASNKLPIPRNLLQVVAIHTLVTWVLVWLVFPMESIHDIVGSPVWQSFRALELTMRFMSLFLLISTLLWSAAAFLLYQLGLAKIRKRRLLALQLIALFVAYLVVIRFAGTDNVIELLQYEGRSWATLFIPVYLMLLLYSGLALSLISRFTSWKFLLHLLIVVVSGPLGYWLIQQGLEGFVIKYGKVFSAMQFLLSTNRENYVQPQELFMRFYIAHYAILVLIFTLQSHIWLGILSKLQKQIIGTNCVPHHKN